MDIKVAATLAAGAVILAASLIGGALILRNDHEPLRFDVASSGFRNAIWVLDRQTGEVSLCAAMEKSRAVRCRAATKLEAAAAAKPPAPSASPNAAAPVGEWTIEKEEPLAEN